MTDRPYFAKDPDEVLDYLFDFKALTNGSGTTDYLEAGETITGTPTITATTGITVDSSSVTDSSTSVTVWLSGGTAGTTYTVTCNAVTSGGRTVDRSIFISLIQK